MAITITGGKYASAAVSSVGTTIVSVSTTPFVSADFNVARRVDLYTSAGVFKGVAFVRAYISTSSLQLETEFFDPKTGATVAQVVGDTVFVSKNWADVVQTGIAVSENVVTVSDTLVFGTSGVSNSLAFHDEDKFVVNTVTTSRANQYAVYGGFLTFGHLQNYAEKLHYGACNFSFANASEYSASFIAMSTAARMCIFGGYHKANGSNPTYFGTAYLGSHTGTDWAFLWVLDHKFDSMDVVSKGSGGNWEDGTNHVVENCSYVGSGTNQIMLRWANGSVLGGQFKFVRNTALPLSVTGSDVAGTYYFGAPAGKRAVILDIGTNNAFWRNGAGNLIQTVNCTNLISTDYRLGTGTAPDSSAQTNGTKNIYFSDPYSNLKDASALATIRDSDWTTDDVQSASGDGSTAALRVFRSTGTGHTMDAARGPWTYRIRKYGYDEIEGSIAEESYPLGTAGTAFNVSFGGAANQIPRESLTDSEATALAYAGITVTDHGASPVTWNAKDWSITVAVDLATYPTRTAAQVFAHIKAGIAKASAWNGKTGLLWHVLMEESGSSYTTQRGKSGGTGASIKGVRIVDQSGNPFPGVATMTADDGTTYTPPVAVILTIAAQVSLVGAEIRIYDLDNSPAGSLGTELAGIESCGDATFPYIGAAGNSVWVQIMLAGYREFGQSLVFPASDSTFTAVLVVETDA